MEFVFDNNMPIYIQLVEQLKIYIISGKIKIGDKLPSVRELALMTKVNPNTMQKALIELENMGLIYTERTNGKFVTTDNKLINKFRVEYAKEKTSKYFYSMLDLGFNKEEIIEYIRKVGDDI